MADKCIGKLTLDISDVEKKVQKINETLAMAGAGVKVDLSKNISAEVKKQLDKVLKEIEGYEKKISEASTKAANAIGQIGEGKVKDKTLKQAIADMREYYQMMTQAERARASGNTENANLFDTKATEAISRVTAELQKQAEGYKTVQKARLAYEAAHNTTTAKASSDEQKQIDEAIKLYERLYEQKAKLDQLKQQGKTESVEYAKTTAEIEKLTAQLDELGRKTTTNARLTDEYNAIIDKYTNVTNAALHATEKQNAKQNETRQLETVRQHYIDLTDAIKNYNISKKAGDTDGMQIQQARIDGIMQEVAGIQQAVNASEMEASTKQKILNIIQQCTTAEHKHSAAVGNVAGEAGNVIKANNEIENQVSNIVTRMFSLMTVIRTINSLISNTVEYVSEYSQKMNEIQIITGKSSVEIEQLGETYRNIAQEMSASSLDMADAAIYFTRQGLGAEEIEKRLRNTTMYAKTANIEFETAAELITAVVNSMNLVEDEAEDGRNAAQRVADVFLKIGDNAATSGKEIGEAMQKAGAAAGAFNMNFEWLASYIATVSETTRQEATSIGTAFNTLIARLHSIRTTGFNSEDETKINDIQKALNNVNVALLDQEGNWRDMTDIFQDVADQWDGLDGKTKSYIATTMAGVKQQNVFLALMEDLSQKTEGTSRAWELYNLAVESAGTASEKYAVYTDSVEAAQSRLNVAQEKFYALLDASIIKGWYDALAGYVDTIATGAEATNNWTLIIPALLGALAGVGVVVHGINAGLTTTLTLTSLLEKHPLILALSAAIAVGGILVTVLNGIASSVGNMKQRYDEANSAIVESQTKIDSYMATQAKAQDMFEDFGDGMVPTNEKLSEYNGLLSSISDISPMARRAVDDLKDGLIDQAEAAGIINAELERLIANEERVTLSNMMKANNNRAKDSAEEFAQSLLELEKDVYDKDGGIQAFVGAMQELYYRGDMPSDIMTEYEDLLDTYMAYMSAEDAYKNAGEDIWKNIFGDAASVSEYLIGQAEEQVDAYLDAIGGKLNTVERGAYKEQIMDAILGDDGQMSAEEYSKYSEILNQFIAQVLNNGIESIAFDNDTLIRSSGEMLFGNYFDSLFGDQLTSLENKDYYAQMISDGISELLDAGFSTSDIADLLRDKKLVDWDKMVDLMKADMKDSIKEAFGTDFLGEIVQSIDMDTGEEATEELEYMWDDLDISTLKIIRDLADMGVTINEINNLMAESSSVDEFKEKLAGLGVVIEETGDSADEDVKTIEDYAKQIKAAQSEITDLDKIIKSLNDGETVDFNDLLDLSAAHPEIMAVIGDVTALKATLEDIKGSNIGSIINDLKSMITTSPEAMKNSPFTGMSWIDEKGVEHAAETIQDVLDHAEQMEAEVVNNIQDYLDRAVISLLASTDQLGSISHDMLGEWMNGLFPESNVDLLNRKAVEIGNDIATVLTETVTASADGHEGIKWNQDIIVNFTPITADGKKLDEETFYKYIDDLFAKSKDVSELWENDKVENGGMGLMISADVDFESFEEGIKDATSLAELLHLLQQAYYGVAEANETWLETQLKQSQIKQENAWAKSNGYAEQIGELAYAADRSDGLRDRARETMEVWNSYNETMRESIAETYPGVLAAMAEVESALKDTEDETKNQDEAWQRLESAMNDAGKALNKTQKYLNTKYFKSTAKAIKDLEEGTISASDAYDIFYKECDKVTKAYDEIGKAQTKIAEKTELTESDVNSLADALGISADKVIEDFPGAVSMFEELRAAGQEAFNELNKEATMRILGVSEADFSNIMNGMTAVQNTADATVQMLLALGAFKLEEREVKEGVTFPIFENGKISSVTASATGKYQFLVPTGKNPFGSHKPGGGGSGKSSGGGGGGGGGGSNSNSMTEVERALDRMSQTHDIYGAQQSYYQAQNKYYDQTGRSQGVIAYSQKEIEVLKEQSKTLEENVKQIEAYMAAKQKELASMSTSDARYEEVADDLDKLQKAHQNYTKQLIENQTAVEALNEEIDEQRKKIRQMQIDLRELIAGAIRDREEKAADMLENEIEMENTILDLITKRYEKERDEILETNQRKIDALEQEKDLLSQQLDLRKQMAEEEDKLAELAELEAQYQRISADPTRRKEALSIQQKIADLRDEIAWNTAEKEVEAQQDSIDQQITSLEDYAEYVEEYYEDLFEHPKQLIEEMREILARSDEEILAWLKANDEEYLKSTENRQKQIEESWQDTLDAMRGEIETYWDEVESIIAQGDEAIIQFLKDHKKEYAEAGKLQAEAYVDEWRKQLEDLRKAQEAVDTKSASNYQTIEKPAGSGGSSGGGGGGGGGSNSGGTSSSGSWNVGWSATQNKYIAFAAKDGKYSTEEAAKTAAEFKNAEARTVLSNARKLADQKNNLSSSYTVNPTPAVNNPGKNRENILPYATGGIADYTGLAWLDGTKDKPERILSPYQTMLFESMVDALESMSRITIPSMPNLGGIDVGGNGPVSVGDIIVNVDNLDTDDDYEELAQKVSEILMERIGRTAVVGGLRINSF